MRNPRDQKWRHVESQTRIRPPEIFSSWELGKSPQYVWWSQWSRLFRRLGEYLDVITMWHCKKKILLPYPWHRLCRRGWSRLGSCPRHDPQVPRGNIVWWPLEVTRSVAPPPACLSSTEHSSGTWSPITRGFPEYHRKNISVKKYFIIPRLRGSIWGARDPAGGQGDHEEGFEAQRQDPSPSFCCCCSGHHSCLLLRHRKVAAFFIATEVPLL